MFWAPVCPGRAHDFLLRTCHQWRKPANKLILHRHLQKRKATLIETDPHPVKRATPFVHVISASQSSSWTGPAKGPAEGSLPTPLRLEQCQANFALVGMGVSRNALGHAPGPHDALRWLHLHPASLCKVLWVLAAYCGTFTYACVLPVFLT